MNNPYSQQLAQNRLNNLEQQQMNMYQQQYIPQGSMSNVQIIKGRPVSSFDEAKASMIDLDGSMFVFTDIANKKIYTKQILLDGSAELKTYQLVESEQNANENKYVLREEFERRLKEFKESLEGGIYNAENTKPDVRD